MSKFDKIIKHSRDLIHINSHAYVEGDTLQMAVAIIEMSEAIESLENTLREMNSGSRPANDASLDDYLKSILQ